MTRVTFTVNGVERALDVEPGERLLDVLRVRLGLTGTKEGCGIGACGACTVLVDGRAENACLVPAASLDGARVVTIEGLSEGGLDPLQQAFLDHHAIQCGFCTPGLVMSARALLDENPAPTEEEIRTAIQGNLCRCTGYEQVIAAIADVAGVEVRALADGGDDTIRRSPALQAGAPFARRPPTATPELQLGTVPFVSSGWELTKGTVPNCSFEGDDAR